MSSSNGPDLGQVMALLGDVVAGQTQMLDRVDRLELRVGEIERQVKELSSQVTAYHGST
jgi:cell division septum initiation protein DivIVA